MTSQRRIGLIATAGAATLALLVLGTGLHWSPWIIIVGVLVCWAFGVLAGRAAAPAPPPPAYQPPAPVPIPPPAVQVVAVQGVNLTSATADYDFLLDATVYWRPNENPPPSERHLRPGARAIDAIITRAAEIAAGEEPAMAVRLQHRLNDVLGVVRADRAGRVETWADQVRVSLPESDAQRLQMLSDVRKDVRLWEHQRRFECDKREYLTDDVLRSTGSALVWWLSRNETEVARAADLIGTMARLSAAARHEDVPALFRHLVPSDLLPPDVSRFEVVGSDGAGQPFGLGPDSAQRTPSSLLAELMTAVHLDDEQRSWFAAKVANDIENEGNTAAADRIRRQFDVIVDEPQPEPATNGARPWPTPPDNPDPTTPTDDPPAE